MKPDSQPIGAILSGGSSRRMGEDKAMIKLGGRPLLDRVVDSLMQQVSSLVIVGGPAEWAGDRGLDYRPDAVTGGRGPLAGLLAAFNYASDIKSGSEYVFVTATDMPFLPSSLVARLGDACLKGRPVLPRSGGRLQPLAALWPRGLCEKLAAGLRDESMESMKDLYANSDFVEVNFDAGPPDPFFNLNTPEDLVAAERRLGSSG